MFILYLYLSLIFMSNFNGVQFTVFDGIGGQWNTENIYRAVLGNSTYGEFSFKFGNLSLGTAIYYSAVANSGITINDTIDGTPYQWDITRIYRNSYLPITIGYLIKKQGNVELIIRSHLSLWGSGERSSLLIDTTDCRQYRLYLSSDKIINLSLEMNIPMSKGFEPYFSLGCNFIHYNKTGYDEEIQRGLNQLNPWEVSPYISAHGRFSLPIYTHEKNEIKNKIGYLTSNISTGLLRLGYLYYLIKGNIRNDFSDVQGYGYIIGTGIGTSLLQTGIPYLALTNSRNNNIFDYITIGISTGVLTGFIDGLMFDYVYYNPSGMCVYNSIIEGVTGGAIGLINYIVSR